MVAEGVVLKCPFCNAPLDVSPDSVVTFCKYCGNVVSTRKFECETIILKNLPFKELEEKVYGYLKSKVGDVSPEKREMTFIPVYTSTVRVNGIAVFEVRDNKRVRIKEVKVDKKLRVATYGRYGNFIGIDYVLREIESGKIRFNKTEKLPEKYTVLAAQKSVEEAKKEIKERGEEVSRPGMHTEKLSDIVGKESFSILESTGVIQSLEGLKFWDAEITLDDVKLLFFPVFLYWWKKRGSRYVTIVDGTDGSVIMSKLPVSTWMRLAAVGIAAAISIVSGFLVTKSLYAVLALGGLSFVSTSFATKEDLIWK